MADDKKADAKPAAKPARQLAPAAESGDPAVHALLARRDGALRNDDADAVAEADKALAALGFEA